MAAPLVRLAGRPVSHSHPDLQALQDRPQGLLVPLRGRRVQFLLLLLPLQLRVPPSPLLLEVRVGRSEGWKARRRKCRPRPWAAGHRRREVLPVSVLRSPLLPLRACRSRTTSRPLPA